MGPVVATMFEATAPASRRGPDRTDRESDRREIVAVPAQREGLRAEARSAFGLEAGRRTVLVVGGSQGGLHLDRSPCRDVAAPS
jgi:UDP-N-acetylglucosamine:LPS N-acetylglucosamine transferase